MNAHKKQFVIGNQPWHVNDDWKTVPIEEGLFLCHCPDLCVATIKDRNSETWYLLGLAVQTDKEKKDPLTEISRSVTSQVRQIHHCWAGRWILIGAAEIHMDCCGLLGCFYTTVSGARWISSSLAILQEIGGFTPRPETLKHKSGMEWYPLPFSRFEGIYQLLSSQILNLKTLHIEVRNLPKPVSGLSYDEIIKKLEEKVKAGLSNACHPRKRVFIQLTAGYDSRSVLAAIHSLGIDAEAYTTEGVYISHADATLPSKIAKAAGCHHRYIRRGPFSEEKEALYDHHTGRNSADIDRMKYSEGQWDLFRKGDLILRGNMFETGTYRIYHYLGSDFTVASMLKYTHLENRPDCFGVQAFSEWMNWVRQTPMDGLGWQDRFYLEQRVGGWLSAIEQSLDLTEPERFTVANCHDILSLMLSASVEKRSARAYYFDLIRNMCPALLQYPFNPPDPKFKKLQKRLIKINKMPLHELYKKLKHRLLN